MAEQRKFKILQENDPALLETSLNDWIDQRIIILDAMEIPTPGIYDTISFTAHLQITNQSRYTAYIEYRE